MAVGTINKQPEIEVRIEHDAVSLSLSPLYFLKFYVANKYMRGQELSYSVESNCTYTLHHPRYGSRRLSRSLTRHSWLADLSYHRLVRGKQIA